MSLKSIIGLFLLFINIASPASTQNLKPNLIKEIIKYNVNVSDNLKDKVPTPMPGIGSSLAFKGKNKEGDLLFYCLTDRGPNILGPKLKNGKHTLIFIEPKFSPFVGIITVKPKELSATLSQIIPIKATGIPWPEKESNIDIPLALDLSLLKTDNNGVDSEGVDVDGERNFWIADEYGPSLIKINNVTGEILLRITPDNGLPKIINERQDNRGFEAIAVTPNGKIYAAMESVLDIDNHTKDNAQFIRIIEFDPRTFKTKMFAYPYEQNTYKNVRDIKLGDMAAIDDNHFIIVEQGASKNGKMSNSVQLIDISQADDLTDLKLNNGKELEYGSLEELVNVKMISKTKILEMKNHGWPYLKMEGLALIDNKTIAIINDNDFAITEKIENTNDKKVTNYVVNPKTKQLFYKGKVSNAKIVKENIPEKHTELWIIKLSQDLLVK